MFDLGIQSGKCLGFGEMVNVHQVLLNNGINGFNLGVIVIEKAGDILIFFRRKLYFLSH